MNSESEQRLSLQELKQRNTQQAVLPTPTPPHEACPSKADWERMMKYMDALWCHADRQTTGADAKNVGVEETNPRRPHFIVTGESAGTGTGD